MRITGTIKSSFSDATIEGVMVRIRVDATPEQVDALPATVDIYPHAEFLTANMECTPENFAHCLARLAHAEDHLAREARSSQALMVVHDGLRLMNDGYHAEVRDLREEVKRLRRVLHKHDISADTSGEEFDDERGRDENGNALA